MQCQVVIFENRAHLVENCSGFFYPAFDFLRIIPVLSSLILSLLTIRSFVLFVFISNPYCALTSTTLFISVCSPSIVSANIMVSSAYRILLIRIPLIGMPSSRLSSASLKICSEYITNIPYRNVHHRIIKY
uniref:Uncharacterized protein n=1 Tax=Cacopsylla melanoneura TaxID=428564 RepID=A0A8D8Z2Z1_9HEMI